MTEEEAQAWVEERFGGDANARIATFLQMLSAENARQNLIAPSTVQTIWVRHVLDSAQLMQWDSGGAWLDIGTGGGFPGVIVAMLREAPVTLVEPRRRRAEFLQHVVDKLDLLHVAVVAGAVEAEREPMSIISARAVGPVEKLLKLAARSATPKTRWILPRGRVTDADLTVFEECWSGMFHVEQSMTDPYSSILILAGAGAR